MRKIVHIKIRDKIIDCQMENGDIFEFDMLPIISKNTPMTIPLQEKQFFEKVFIELGALSWPNGFEIHADTIEKDGKLLKKKLS